MSFTVVMAMIFTASAASLARETEVNQNGFGAKCKAQYGNETVDTQSGTTDVRW